MTSSRWSASGTLAPAVAPIAMAVIHATQSTAGATEVVAVPGVDGRRSFVAVDSDGDRGVDEHGGRGGLPPPRHAAPVGAIFAEYRT